MNLVSLITFLYKIGGQINNKNNYFQDKLRLGHIYVQVCAATWYVCSYIFSMKQIKSKLCYNITCYEVHHIGCSVQVLVSRVLYFHTIWSPVAPFQQQSPDSQASPKK